MWDRAERDGRDLTASERDEMQELVKAAGSIALICCSIECCALRFLAWSTCTPFG